MDKSRLEQSIAALHLWANHDTQAFVCHDLDGTIGCDKPTPPALLPGSFNPFHHGHARLAEAASKRLGLPVAFELSIVNVDKPSLVAEEIARRLDQFVDVGPIWITRAPTFRRKAELFPGTAFVLGFDTAARLVDPRYYSNEASLRNEALQYLIDSGCRIVVGGRVDERGVFRTWASSHLPSEGYQKLFVSLEESDFRADVSSTLLRETKAKTPR